MKTTIINALARHGWAKEQIVDAFVKVFETFVAPKKATIWLRFVQEDGYWLLTNGDFTSAGNNVLAGVFLPLPVSTPPDEIEQSIGTFVALMESRIAQAWSVRLMNDRE